MTLIASSGTWDINSSWRRGSSFKCEGLWWSMSVRSCSSGLGVGESDGSQQDTRVGGVSPSGIAGSVSHIKAI
jgi:hypothetical protein